MKQATIALIGFRGAGKTSVGRVLARLLQGELIDTDELIVKSAGRSIADIFTIEGEGGFRRREGQAVEEAVRRRPPVISVGGGAVLDERNVERLRSTAWLVFLDAPAEVLWSRIQSDPAGRTSRPALTSLPGIEEVRELLKVRRPLYLRIADRAVDASVLSMERLAQQIKKDFEDYRAQRADSGQSTHP